FTNYTNDISQLSPSTSRIPPPQYQQTRSDASHNNIISVQRSPPNPTNYRGMPYIRTQGLQIPTRGIPMRNMNPQENNMNIPNFSNMRTDPRSTLTSINHPVFPDTEFGTINNGYIGNIGRSTTD